MYRAVRPGSQRGLVRSAAGTDSYLNKLVKYVPVEGLAPFVPLAAMAKDSSVQLWVTFVMALFVGLVLMAAQVAGTKKEDRPRVWFWPFVVLSFAAWSVGASQEFRGLLNVSQSFGGWFLALTAGALPALDTGLEKIFKRKER